MITDAPAIGIILLIHNRYSLFKTIQKKFYEKAHVNP